MRSAPAFIGLALVVVIGGFFVVQTNGWLIQSRAIPLTANVAALFEQKKVASELPLPVRLTIPKIKVDATVEQVGLTSGKAVDVPKGPANAAWFKLGPRPGDAGTAIIVGHSGWKDNKPASFDNLAKLRPGDRIFVTDEKGATTTFVVSKSQRYDPTADASKVFVSNDGRSHLNLITCEGIWDAVAKSYSKRLVIFSDKE